MTPLAERIAELQELMARATEGPYDHMEGRGLVRALRGDMAIPLYEVQEANYDPARPAPTVRQHDGSVLFRAKSHNAETSVGFRRQRANGDFLCAILNTLPDLLASHAAQKARIAELEAGLRALLALPLMCKWTRETAGVFPTILERARSLLSPTQDDAK